jgi:hypothetical protein
MRKAIFVAFLLILGSVVLGATVLREPIAWAATPFQNVIVSNDASNPVLTKVTNNASAPVPVTLPQWQGEPYVTSRVVLGSQCNDFPAIPAGKILYAQRVIVRFNVAPGMTGSAGLRFQPLGAGSSSLLDAAVHRTSPAQQIAGIYDAYAGVLEIGQPTASTMEACTFAGAEDDIAGTFTVMGYLLPAS